MTGTIAGLAFFAFMAILMGAMAFAGPVNRNSAVGIKTRWTLANDEAWRAGHAAAQPWLLSAAVACLIPVVTFLVLLIAQSEPSNILIAITYGVGLACYFYSLALATVRANRAAKLHVI